MLAGPRSTLPASSTQSMLWLAGLKSVVLTQSAFRRTYHRSSGSGMGGFETPVVFCGQLGTSEEGAGPRTQTPSLFIQSEKSVR